MNDPGRVTPPGLAGRLLLVALAAVGGAITMSLLWLAFGRSVGPDAQGPALFASTVSLWWGLFSIVGIAAAAGALVAGRGEGVPRERQLRWIALCLSVLLLLVGRGTGAIPF